MINGIPKNEQIWEIKTTRSGEVYYITSKDNSLDYYFLYKMDNNRAVKLGKAKIPTELERKYIK